MFRGLHGKAASALGLPVDVVYIEVHPKNSTQQGCTCQLELYVFFHPLQGLRNERSRRAFIQAFQTRPLARPELKRAGNETSVYNFVGVSTCSLLVVRTRAKVLFAR